MESVIYIAALLSLLCINALPLDKPADNSSLPLVQVNKIENVFLPVIKETDNSSKPTLKVNKVENISLPLVKESEYSTMPTSEIAKKVQPMNDALIDLLTSPTITGVNEKASELKQTEINTPSNKTTLAESDKVGKVSIDSRNSPDDLNELECLPEGLGTRLSVKLLKVLTRNNLGK